MKRLLHRLCLGALLTVSSLAAAQAPVTPANIDTRRIDDRIRALQREADTLARSARTLVRELRALEVERDLRAAEAVKADEAVAEARRQLQRTDTRLAQLEQERTEQMPGLSAQLVNLYKSGTLGYAKVLFGAADVRELGRASRTVTAMVARDRRRIEEHRRTLAALREQRTVQATQAGELKGRQTAAAQARASADRAVAAHARRLAQIDTERDLAAQYVGELQVAREALNRQLADDSAVPVPFLPFRGALDWPVPGRVTGRFGQAANRLGGTAVRNGLEIGGTDGAPVRAVHGGTVAHADTYPGFGNLVILDHGGNNYSLYGYLGAISVTMGQHVEAGTELGAVGPSPAGPAALYFELRVDGRPVDPVQWLEPR